MFMETTLSLFKALCPEARVSPFLLLGFLFKLCTCIHPFLIESSLTSSLKKTWQHSKAQDVQRAANTRESSVYAMPAFITNSCPRFYECISGNVNFKAVPILNYTQH